MHKLYAEAKYGQSGNFIARITGRDSKFTFNREFIGSTVGKRDKAADIDTDGLYETCSVDSKGRKDHSYYVILDCPNLEVLPGFKGTLRKQPMSKEEAMKIAKLLDEGWKVSDVVKLTPSLMQDGITPTYKDEILTPSKIAEAKASQTLETAVDSCWKLMDALPQKEQLEVLKRLKALAKPASVVEVPND